MEQFTNRVLGMVHECVKLNIRAAPAKTADIKTVEFAGTFLTVDLDKSTDDWYCVWNAEGIEGFCMKQYVTIDGISVQRGW